MSRSESVPDVKVYPPEAQGTGALGGGLRLVMIEVPTELEYSLYPKRETINCAERIIIKPKRQQGEKV